MKQDTSPKVKESKSQEKNRKTLGPVADLERHLPPQWWKSLFNALYLKTDGDVVENEENTRKEVDAILESVPLPRSAKIIDLCCGQGRHVLELGRRGYFHTYGLDQSRYLIRQAKKRAQQANLPVSFHEGDVRRFRLKERNFDLATIMGNSFGYFEQPDEDIEVLQNIRKLLKPGGYLILDVTDGDYMRSNYSPRSWEWIDQNHLVNRERTLSQDGSRLISRELVIHAEKGVLADQFYAERLYTVENLKEILASVGFENIVSKLDIVTESTRNQDLGMMARRVFIICRNPQEAEPEPDVKKIDVTVLLGDPRLPDPVKLNGKFNPEDLDTVMRLKTALKEAKGYRFQYLDNHAEMITRLMHERPALVLNLCDEGFENDPLKELHVPALLEMLKIPYTGAGPVSLGLCYDKAFTRLVAEAIGIPVPMQTIIEPEDNAVRLPSVFPALLKPAKGDSSIGITQKAVVHDANELVSYFNYLREIVPDIPILAQEFLSGAEYTVGVIGNPGIGLEFLPILTVDYSALESDLPPILSYESKWDPDSPYWTNIRYVEAVDLDDENRRKLQDYSALLFERMGCRDYARFDFRGDAHGRLKLLEVNPNPGWCWDGKFNLMAEMGGMSYSELLEKILNAAMLRYGLV